MGKLGAIGRVLALLLTLLVAAAFPWGPLFPWSPWKPGFEHLALQRADVYYPVGTEPKVAYRELDHLIAGAEAFLQLSADKRITVVVTGGWGQFRRFLPHMRGTGVGAVTLATGTAIYVSPKLNERGFDHGEFLRHELAHALVNQHQSLWNAFAVTKVEWLSEGLCVAYGDQKAYITREEFLERAGKEDVAAVIDPDRKPANLDMRFAYVAWRSFVEYLMNDRGRDRFQQFLQSTMKQPREWRRIFAEVYGESFSDLVNAWVLEMKAANSRCSAGPRPAN